MEDEHPVLVEDDVVAPAGAECCDRPLELLGVTELVAVARPLQVDRDPARLAEYREAEDTPSLGEVAAEHVRRADRDVRRHEPEMFAAALARIEASGRFEPVFDEDGILVLRRVR